MNLPPPPNFSSRTARRAFGRAAVSCAGRAAIAGALLGLGACVTETVTPLRPDLETVDRERQLERLRETRAAPPEKPKIESYDSHVIAAVQPRGTIPYDGETLPIVSPDGRYLATQTGIEPNWAAILAEPGATISRWSRIEIYELPLVGNDPPVRVGHVDEPALLGRSCDRAGFLIEATRPDGSRWIGKAAWTGGGVTWLVQDPSHVSAFASLGPEGRLAWSSRPVDGGSFDLVVRRGRVDWRMPGGGGDWLMPTWSCASANDGDGLFALVMRGEMLDVVHLVARDPESARRTIQRVPLASRNADVYTAYQTVIAHDPAVRENAGERDRLTFIHPARLRAAVWEPPSTPVLLNAGSFAATLDSDDDGYVLMSTMTDLIRRNIAQERVRSKLIAGPHLARPTEAVDRPYVLLNPDPANAVIGVTVLKLLSPDG